ncbi:hypothetical protein MCEMIEM28_01007 [Burkholderiaceae bacterium]
MAQISTLPTQMPPPSAGALAFAAAWNGVAGASLAQLTLIYVGWTVLAHMGMHLSLLWWSGMSALVLWWVLRVWQPERAWQHHRAWHAALWMLSVGGVCLMQSPLPASWRWLGLLALAAGLAGTSNALGRQSSSRATANPWVLLRTHALAIALVAFMAADFVLWSERWALLLLVLSAATVVLLSQPRTAPSPSAVWRNVDPNMAVMMGSLTLMSQWCVSQGLSAPLAMGMHLGIMAVAEVFKPFLHRSVWASTHAHWGHGLSVLAAVAMLLSTQLTPMLLAMGLLALGCAWVQAGSLVQQPRTRLWIGTALGLISLLLTAQWAPTLGPAAIGWGLLGVSSTWALWALGNLNRRST